MALSLLWTGMAVLAFLFSVFCGSGADVAAAALSGAQEGIALTISLGGALCLWTGLGKLMEAAGLTQTLARVLRPLLRRLFPHAMQSPAAARPLCCNLTANLLGLGNAATPFGIAAARAMAQGRTTASDELCRFVVLNTASIQLLPATVAAMRASLGCAAPFDILPAVWCASVCSVAVGLLAAWGCAKLWR